MQFSVGVRVKAIAVFPLLLLLSCNDDPYTPLQKMVDQTDRLARICLRDVAHVPFEHSGNCIAAAKFFWDHEAKKTPERSVCFEQRSSVCHKIGDREGDVLGGLHNSIAQSLFRFGKPQLVLTEERSGTHNLQQHDFNFYRSVPDLEAAFANCLVAYPNPPAPPRSDPATFVDGKPVISMPPLQNHNCIPEGVDLFGWRPLP